MTGNSEVTELIRFGLIIEVCTLYSLNSQLIDRLEILNIEENIHSSMMSLVNNTQTFKHDDSVFFFTFCKELDRTSPYLSFGKNLSC